jgi:Mg/Co/Ni transporter MgtE
VGDIMNSQPAIIGDQEDARAAARVMEEKETHRVFVVDKDGNLVGIVSLGKVARTEDETLAGQVVKSISHPRRKETA